MTGTQKQRPDGWWYPWIFVFGMALVFIANGAMVMLALGTFNGLETEKQYEKGIHYNRALAGARAQEALGWDMAFDFVAGEVVSGRHGGRVDLVFTDANDRPLDDLDVRLVLIRPTTDGFDSEATAAPAGNGRYRGTFDLPLPGNWDVRVLAYHGQDVYQAVHRIQVP